MTYTEDELKDIPIAVEVFLYRATSPICDGVNYQFDKMAKNKEEVEQFITDKGLDYKQFEIEKIV